MQHAVCRRCVRNVSKCPSASREVFCIQKKPDRSLRSRSDKARHMHGTAGLAQMRQEASGSSSLFFTSSHIQHHSPQLQIAYRSCTFEQPHSPKPNCPSASEHPLAVMSAQPAPTVEISLPQEQQTPLPEQERSQILDPQSGETLPEERTKDVESGHHILVCLDPEAQQGQSDAAVEAAKRAIKPGDTVILYSVMSPVAWVQPLS